MADSTPQQPYQFGDVVNGHRWTITGWEPLSPPERTVGVPRLLEARYAATQAAREQSQLATMTDDPDPIVVVDDHDAALDAVTVAHESDEADGTWAPTGTVVAAPDLAIDYGEAPAEAPEVHDGDDDASMNGSLDGRLEDDEHNADDEGDDDGPIDARPESLRAWYGLGWESEPDPEPEQQQNGATYADPHDDAAFAAALAHGSRALAEQHEPSEIEIAAGIASRTRSDDDAPWMPMGWEQIDEWTGSTSAPQQPALDDQAGPFSPGPFSVATIPAPALPIDPDPEPKAVTYSPAPPQGWYPGSV